MRGRFKKWAAPYIAEHGEIIVEKVDPEDPFLKVDKLTLEIGAGKGDFALCMAPRTEGNYLAIERDVSVAATFAKKAENSGLGNLRIIRGDFDQLYEELQKFRFQRIYLNFSDPWPKKKHSKRRLTSGDRLAEFDKILAKGGEIRFKTDADVLYESTLENLEGSPFAIVYRSDDYAFEEADDAMSEYERKARDLGKPIHRLILKRKTDLEEKI